MNTVLIIVHIVVAVALILTVLLQRGKGASMGAAFGGGSSGTVFGSRGPAGFMSKLTAVAAIVFMLTCLALSIIGSRRTISNSIMETTTTSAPAPGETPSQRSTSSGDVPAKAPETAPPLPKEQAQPIAPAPAPGANK